MPKGPKSVISAVAIERHIHVVRGQKVMFDSDLAVLYGVPTRTLNQAVQRNRERFPDDFMFTLTHQEVMNLRSQIVISNKGRGGRRYLPHVFTELGVAMLSSVLNSERAIRMNIAIMRSFVRLREVIAKDRELAARVEKLERGHDRTASVIEVLVEDIDRLARTVEQLREPPPQPKRKMGFDL